MRREPIEIKVTLSERVPDARRVLDLGEGSKLSIWFLEDLTPGRGDPLPLLAAGVILRLRSRKDVDDSTVKLRPCRRSQLPWWAVKDKDDGWEFSIESDWAGPRRSLAASSGLTLPVGRVAAATDGDGDLRQVFDERQLSFLHQCADIPVHPAGLSALGPIDATKWKNVGLDVPGLPDGDDVFAEWWSVAGLDFLELSIQLKPDADVDAEDLQASFEAAVRARGLELAVSQQPKTTQVLERLALESRT